MYIEILLIDQLYIIIQVFLITTSNLPVEKSFLKINICMYILQNYEYSVLYCKIINAANVRQRFIGMYDKIIKLIQLI